MSSVSAVFPCYNDGGTIASMVLLSILTLEKVTDDFEIIVVDDGSSDHSREILRRLSADYPALSVIYHHTNQGYGGALRSAFAAASKELVFYTDGDAQYDVRELTNLLKALTPEIDIVQGYKRKRHDPWHRVVIGLIYQHLIRYLFSLHIRDVDCDFRLIRRKVLQTITLEHTSGVICVEMVRKMQDAGFRFYEVPVHHFFRAYGKSQFFNFPRLLRVAYDLVFLWWKLVARPFLHRRSRSAS